MIRALGYPSNIQKPPDGEGPRTHCQLGSWLAVAAFALQLVTATAGELRVAAFSSGNGDAPGEVALIRLSFAMAATNWRFPDGKPVVANTLPRKVRAQAGVRLPHYVASQPIAVQLLPAESDARLLTGIASAPEVVARPAARRQLEKPVQAKHARRNRKQRLKPLASIDNWKMRALFRD